jgi:hypothetical protein
MRGRRAADGRDARAASTSWRASVRRHPSAVLLAALLVSLLLFPWIDITQEGRLLFGAVALVVIPLAVWVVNRSPSSTWIAWLLAIPAIALTVAGVLLGMPRVLPWSASLEALLYFYAAGSLIHYMLRDLLVTADELFAAGAAFTLLAWGFAYAYFACQAWVPGSFTGLEPERARSWVELLSMSFSNLSATGSGDVIAVGPVARVLVMLEQFAGVGYIAAVVSRLLGLTLASHAR